jgi:hypothetical protein
LINHDLLHPLNKKRGRHRERKREMVQAISRMAKSVSLFQFFFWNMILFRFKYSNLLFFKRHEYRIKLKLIYFIIPTEQQFISFLDSFKSYTNEAEIPLIQHQKNSFLQPIITDRLSEDTGSISVLILWYLLYESYVLV